MKLSIVSPVYKAEQIVDELVSRIREVAGSITDDYEIILVEDGSPDNSWNKIMENCSKFAQVKGVKLSRNFGQHYAITAGVFKSSGDYVILMDCDLQDDPIYIKDLLTIAKDGYDIVFTRRKERKHGFVKRFNSWLYNQLFNLLSEKKYNINAGSLVLFSKKVATEFLKLKDKDRLYIQILKWVGFSNTSIEVEHKERLAGESSYNFIKLMKMGVQGWTSHSDKLLRISIYIGFSLAILSFLSAGYIMIRYFLYQLMPGWPSLIIAILFSTGLILISIGVAGIYIGKIFEQSKDRPLFIIDKTINLDEQKNN